MTENVIIIPTRLEAKRLPNKPIKKINNKEMILHVYEAAKKANIGDVIVASPDHQICELIASVKGICVKTKSDHETGTDRVFEVFDKFLNKKPHNIINLQGDMPNIDPSAIKMLSSYISKNVCDIATLASKFKDRKEIENINIHYASLLAMKRAIKKLKIKPTLVLIDGNKLLEIKNYNQKCIIKGDQKIPSISATILGAESCNGWTYWHYNLNGSAVPIDHLRQRLINNS